MNDWMKKKKNEELFFRFDREEVRAIFTPRYRPVDNFEVLERLDSLGYGPDTQVQCHLDAEFMLVSIPDGNQTFSVNGDRLTPGISVSNSEVGFASLSIAAFFRSVDFFRDLHVNQEVCLGILLFSLALIQNNFYLNPSFVSVQ